MLVLLLSLAGVVSVLPARAQTPAPFYPLTIYFFWGEGCPHCASAKPFFESLPARYPGVTLKSYEVYYNQANQQIFTYMAQKYNLQSLGVPTFFIGPYYLQGYLPEYNPDIEAVVKLCLEQGCIDAGDAVPGITVAATPTVGRSRLATQTPIPLPAAGQNTTPAATTAPPTQPGTNQQPLNQDHVIQIPFFGKVNLDLQSTGISTALIAFVDGFNPCSLWVLSMLLALTLHTGSRKKVLLIGLVFLTVTAGIYALFIAGLFSVLKLTGFLGWIQVVVALIALFFALVNIKDYFWYKEGLSFTIADDKKAGIFKRMRAVMDASQSLVGLVTTTVVLAVGVSMVEFSCTAGFPVLWVNLLSAQAVSGGAFVVLLLLYMLIYQLDEMIIFLSAVVSLKASRMEEKHGRILKLVGGMLMLTLSVVMLVNPALMNNLSSSLLIFGAAFAGTLLVLLAHRVILPRLGIRIGSGS